MTARRSISKAMRARVFAAHKGRCWLCRGIIATGEKWQVEHQVALVLGGADDETNMAPAHVDCHRTKTSGRPATSHGSDVHAAAKIRRLTRVKSARKHKRIAGRGFPPKEYRRAAMERYEAQQAKRERNADPS